MSEVYIQPFIASLQGILGKYLPQMLSGTGCEPFMQVGICFTGVMENPPEAWVMPVRTQIDDAGNNYDEMHFVTVKFGVTASDPDSLAKLAMTYMTACTLAINAAQPADWQGPTPRHVHVFEHDYGTVYEANGILARFPELHVQIEATEL